MKIHGWKRAKKINFKEAKAVTISLFWIKSSCVTAPYQRFTIWDSVLAFFTK